MRIEQTPIERHSCDPVIFGGKLVDSVKHHYIPRLYLKGFTCSNGRMQVYDKKYCKFKKEKQTPATVFFEKNRNTIRLHGKLTDSIEGWYSTIETSFGQLFNFIRSEEPAENLISKNGIYLLKLYLAFQFWRLPLTDYFAESYIRNIDLKRFGRRITINGNGIGEIDEIVKLLKEDLGFRHYFRSFLLPLLTFDLRVSEEDLKKWRLHVVPENEGGWDNILCCDNPMLVEDLTKMFSFESKLIFPLSKTQLLSYSPNIGINSEFEPIFSTRVSMLTFSQSIRYTAGANKKYINEIVRLFGEVYGKTGIERLRSDVFNEL